MCSARHICAGTGTMQGSDEVLQASNGLFRPETFQKVDTLLRQRNEAAQGSLVYLFSARTVRTAESARGMLTPTTRRTLARRTLVRRTIVRRTPPVLTQAALCTPHAPRTYAYHAFTYSDAVRPTHPNLPVHPRRSFRIAGFKFFCKAFQTLPSVYRT